MMTATMVGDLPGIISNRFGKEMNKLLVQEVTHCLSMRCIVFSITKLLLEGWNLGGNKDAIWFEKNKKRITFDIKLNTKYGIMFYIYFKRYKSSSEINTVDSGKAHDLLRRCNR